MSQSANRKAIRWLCQELPALVSSGTITPENSRAIERYYEAAESRTTNFGFVLLAIVGASLVGAGIILLIAHNWDDLSRGARSVIAFLPLVIAQALGFFFLLRRNESRPWRESVAILNVAAVATAISLVSQTYQIQGTFSDFMRLWLLLSIPIVYLFRTTLGAITYIVGTIVLRFEETSWFGRSTGQLWFWGFLLLVLPYYAGLFRRDRQSRATFVMSIFLVLAAVVGLGFTAAATRANLGGVAFAGLFTAVYLCGINFFQESESKRLSALALIGGLGIGVTTVVLSFENMWHMRGESSWGLTGATRGIGIAIELFFPVAAIALLVLGYMRQRVSFAIAAVLAPVVAAIAWIIANLAPATRRGEDSPYSMAASLIFDVYGLLLGIELLGRGIRAGSIARANFGLLIIAALALARFFDSDMDFSTRGVGFIIVGLGFLGANVLLFKRKATA
jgi:uncharacterized membrane protein